MELEIFSDETQIEDKNGKEYLGISCLFIPTSYKSTLSNNLSKLRYQNKNDHEITKTVKTNAKRISQH